MSAPEGSAQAELPDPGAELDATGLSDEEADELREAMREAAERERVAAAGAAADAEREAAGAAHRDADPELGDQAPRSTDAPDHDTDGPFAVYDNDELRFVGVVHDTIGDAQDAIADLVVSGASRGHDLIVLAV